MFSPFPRIAQTPVQLFDQVRCLVPGSGAEYGAWRRAIDLAKGVFVGQYRPSGRSQLDHAIGTASVLLSAGASPDLALAGLLHRAYWLGDFGDGMQEITPAKQARVQAAIGPAAEAYVAAANRLPWNGRTIHQVARSLAEFTPRDHAVILLHLAAELDGWQDARYSQSAYDARQKIARSGKDLCEIARTLQGEFLAHWLASVMQEIVTDAAPPELVADQRFLTLVAPASLRGQRVCALPAVDLPTVAIIITQRERWSASRQSLATLYATTPEIPFQLIYVDGNSPESIATDLQQQSIARKFDLLRFERFLGNNEARNLAIAHLNTHYPAIQTVIFLENDAFVTPGAIAQLLRCAQETDADIVHPTYLLGKINLQAIHMAGGAAHLFQHQGQRWFNETPRFLNERLWDVGFELSRRTSENFEFHCVLFQRHALDRLAPFDPAYEHLRDHCDLALLAQQCQLKVYYEPNALVTYWPPTPLQPVDLPLFLHRWRDEANHLALQHFEQKWQLSPDDPQTAIHRRWMVWHREHLLLGSRRSLAKHLNQQTLQAYRDRYPEYRAVLPPGHSCPSLDISPVE